MARLIDVGSLLDRPKLDPFRLRIVVVCWLIAVLDGFDVQAMAFVAPALSKAWAIPREAMGQILTAGIAGILVGSFALGRLSDRVGRRPVLLLSILWFATASLATAFCTSTTGLLWLRFLTGVGLGGVTIAALTLTAEYAPTRLRATVVTAMYVGFPIGGIVGGLVAAPLIAAFGWQSLFIVGGIIPLLVAACVWNVLPESIAFSTNAKRDPRTIGALLSRMTPDYRYESGDQFHLEEANSPPKARLREVFAQNRLRGTLLLGILCFANLLVLYLLVSWLPSILSQAGLPVSAANWGAATFNLGGVMGALALSHIVDRYRSTFFLAASYALAAISIGLLAQSAGAALMITLTLLAGVGVIGSQFCVNAVAAAYYPTAIRSTGVGCVLGVGRVGSIVGPLAAGAALGAGVSPHSLLAWLSVPMLICAVAAWCLAFEQRSSARIAR